MIGDPIREDRSSVHRRYRTVRVTLVYELEIGTSWDWAKESRAAIAQLVAAADQIRSFDRLTERGHAAGETAGGHDRDLAADPAHRRARRWGPSAVSGATPPPEASGAPGTEYRVSRCRVCGDRITSSGRRGPRRSLCEKPSCGYIARARVYIQAAVRALERAGVPSDVTWEIADWAAWAESHVSTSHQSHVATSKPAKTPTK